MLRVSKQARKDAGRYERDFPGQVELECATRDAARLRVWGEAWEFEVKEGRMLLKHYPDLNVPLNLHRLAFIRAKEAIVAVRAGHREALARRQKQQTRKKRETKYTAPRNTQASLFP